MSAPNQQASQLTFRQVLAIRDFRRLWLAQVVSLFGDFLALFAILNVASFKIHASATQITWITISFMLPAAVIGPVIGVFVDRWPLKPTLVASDLIRAAITVGFLFATEMWHFYLISVLMAVVSTFFTPAQGVGIRVVVPREGQMAATSMMQQVMYIMRIAGPGLSGIIIASFGPVACYVSDTASFLISAAILASIPLIRPAAPAPQPGSEAGNATGVRRVWLDLRGGFDFLLHHGAVLFVVLALASAIFAIGCFGPLIAVHVRDNLHAETKVFSAASSLIGIGMFLGITFLRRLTKRFTHQQLVYSGLGGMAVFVALLGATSNIPVTLACCAIVGLCVSAVIIPAQTLLQTETPQHLLGRVGSTVMSTVFGAQIIGLVLSGELARMTSIREVFFVTAVTLLMLMGMGRVFLHHRAAAAAVAGTTT